jgi:hypothetical protein
MSYLLKIILNIAKVGKVRFYFIIVILFFSHNLRAQSDSEINDSTIATSFLKKAGLENPNKATLNENGMVLNLSKSESLKIAKRSVYRTYGRFKMIRQKPFQFYELNDYWIVWGNFNYHNIRRMEGYFICIVNTRNGCVEYLIHGK